MHFLEQSDWPLCLAYNLAGMHFIHRGSGLAWSYTAAVLHNVIVPL